MKSFDAEEIEEFEDPEEAHFKEKSKRAQRRHHKKRMKNKAKKTMKNNHWFDDDDEQYERVANKLADNMTVCSCDQCGNPRHHYRGTEVRTTKEILAEKSMQEQLEELNQE